MRTRSHTIMDQHKTRNSYVDYVLPLHLELTLNRLIGGNIVKELQGNQDLLFARALVYHLMRKTQVMVYTQYPLRLRDRLYPFVKKLLPGVVKTQPTGMQYPKGHFLSQDVTHIAITSDMDFEHVTVELKMALYDLDSMVYKEVKQKVLENCHFDGKPLPCFFSRLMDDTDFATELYMFLNN